MKKELSGACSMMGREGVAYRVWWTNLRESVHLQDVSVDGRIIKMNFQDVRWEDME
jgi:hypothetical protein